jgi:hypothetical protein
VVRLLTASPRTALPSAWALRALGCFHLPRLADDGSLLLLPEQDRSRWDGTLLAEAFAALERAGSGEELTRFHLAPTQARGARLARGRVTRPDPTRGGPGPPALPAAPAESAASGSARRVHGGPLERPGGECHGE